MTIKKNVPKKEWTKLDANEFIMLMFEMYKFGLSDGLHETRTHVDYIPLPELEVKFNSAVNELFEKNNLHLKNKNVL